MTPDALVGRPITLQDAFIVLSLVALIVGLFTTRIEHMELRRRVGALERRRGSRHEKGEEPEEE